MPGGPLYLLAYLVVFILVVFLLLRLISAI